MLELPLQHHRAVVALVGDEFGRLVGGGGPGHKLEPAGQGVDKHDVGEGAVARVVEIDREVEFFADPGRVAAGPLAEREFGAAGRFQAERGRAAVGGHHLGLLPAHHHHRGPGTGPCQRHVEADHHPWRLDEFGPLQLVVAHILDRLHEAA